jgi:hypothetical protein
MCLRPILQVMMKDGSWRDVHVPEGSFVINLGDLMQRWTNDRWMSTRHRVVNPPLDIAAVVRGRDKLRCRCAVGSVATTAVALYICVQRDTRRQSVAYFHNLNREITVTTLPSCIDAEHPEKYGPINAFEHLMERHARAVGASKVFLTDKDTTDNHSEDLSAPPSSGAAAK